MAWIRQHCQKIFQEKFYDKHHTSPPMEYKIQFTGPTGPMLLKRLKIIRMVNGRRNIIGNYNPTTARPGSMAVTANAYYEMKHSSTDHVSFMLLTAISRCP